MHTTDYIPQRALGNEYSRRHRDPVTGTKTQSRAGGEMCVVYTSARPMHLSCRCQCVMLERDNIIYRYHIQSVDHLSHIHTGGRFITEIIDDLQTNYLFKLHLN